jgi:hypothetical protein
MSLPNLNQLLRYTPPAQTNPTTYALTTGFQSITAGINEDVLINGGSITKTGKLIISGGRNVRVVGGTFAPTSGDDAIQFNVYNSFSIEGAEGLMSAVNGDWLDGGGFRGPPATTQAMTYPDVYIQNCRVTGLNGTAATTHADGYQAQNPIGNLYVDKLTLSSNYQGLFLRTYYGVSGGYYISRANFTKVVNAANPITFLIWIADNGASAFLGETDPIVPSWFSDVYLSLPAGQTLAANGVYPSAGVLYSDGTPIGALDDGNGNAYWPAATKASGMVLKGTPPNGDFVVAGIGNNYVSPGYWPSTVVLPPSSGKILTA